MRSRLGFFMAYTGCYETMLSLFDVQESVFYSAALTLPRKHPVSIPGCIRMSCNFLPGAELELQLCSCCKDACKAGEPPTKRTPRVGALSRACHKKRFATFL